MIRIRQYLFSTPERKQREYFSILEDQRSSATLIMLMDGGTISAMGIGALLFITILSPLNILYIYTGCYYVDDYILKIYFLFQEIVFTFVCLFIHVRYHNRYRSMVSKFKVRGNVQVSDALSLSALLLGGGAAFLYIFLKSYIDPAYLCEGRSAFWSFFKAVFFSFGWIYIGFVILTIFRSWIAIGRARG